MVSASIEEMNESIAGNAESAKFTDGIASQVAQDAAESGLTVRSTVTAMNQITAISTHPLEKVKVFVSA